MGKKIEPDNVRSRVLSSKVTEHEKSQAKKIASKRYGVNESDFVRILLLREIKEVALWEAARLGLGGDADKYIESIKEMKPEKFKDILTGLTSINKNKKNIKTNLKP